MGGLYSGCKIIEGITDNCLECPYQLPWCSRNKPLVLLYFNRKLPYESDVPFKKSLNWKWVPVRFLILKPVCTLGRIMLFCGGVPAITQAIGLPVCQQWQSERIFPIFVFTSWFLCLLPDFPSVSRFFFTLCPNFFFFGGGQFLMLSETQGPRGTLPPLLLSGL